ASGREVTVALDVPAIVATAEGARALSTLGASAGALRSWEGATGFVAIDLPEEPATKNPSVDPTRAARLLRIETALRDARVPLDLGDVSTLATLRASVA